MNIIDLFCGCGGLTEGFLTTKKFTTLAIVDWDKPSLETLKNRMKTKWKYDNIDDISIHFDLQKIDQLQGGFSDETYGVSKGLKSIVGNKKVDLIIGGPPCQAYSIAGRVKDKNGMKEDYRNFLFESFVKLVDIYKPKAFIFENVMGILSAKPGDQLITDRIYKAFDKIGYTISDDLRRDALFDMSYYGIPQERKRVIIYGVPSKKSEKINEFYKELRIYKSDGQESLGRHLDRFTKFTPTKYKNDLFEYKSIGKNTYRNHTPRKHNKRDIEIFRILSEDIENETFKYVSTEAKIKLYKKFTGRESNFHKHHVLRKDKPSNTIPAHLYKDGLRHIHPDSKQARSLTPREAAAIQTFPDSFEFLGSQTEQYKMIGNAVPPKFSNLIAKVLLKIHN